MKQKNTQNNIAEMITIGMWQIPYAVKNCLCPDGKRRYVKITGHADTFFSIPAKVKYKRKSVSGFVMGNDRDDNQHDFEFIPYTYGKNGHLFDIEKENNENI